MTLDESEIPMHCQVLATDSRSFRNYKYLRGIAPFRQNFLEARMHASNLLTGARECFPAARVAIWWQAVGGSEDESCQWRPLKKTTHTHTPVTGEAWWMIISRCDRCCIGGGGALTIHAFLPPTPLCLPLRLLAYLGQCFNFALTQL